MSAKASTIFESHFHGAKVVYTNSFAQIDNTIFSRAFDTPYPKQNHKTPMPPPPTCGCKSNTQSQSHFYLWRQEQHAEPEPLLLVVARAVRRAGATFTSGYKSSTWCPCRFHLSAPNCAHGIFHKQTLDYRRHLAAVLWQLMYRYGNLGAKARLCWNIPCTQ